MQNYKKIIELSEISFDPNIFESGTTDQKQQLLHKARKKISKILHPDKIAGMNANKMAKYRTIAKIILEMPETNSDELRKLREEIKTEIEREEITSNNASKVISIFNNLCDIEEQQLKQPKKQSQSDILVMLMVMALQQAHIIWKDDDRIKSVFFDTADKPAFMQKYYDGYWFNFPGFSEEDEERDLLLRKLSGAIYKAGLKYGREIHKIKSPLDILTSMGDYNGPMHLVHLFTHAPKFKRRLLNDSSILCSLQDAGCSIKLLTLLLDNLYGDNNACAKKALNHKDSLFLKRLVSNKAIEYKFLKYVVKQHAKHKAIIQISQKDLNRMDKKNSSLIEKTNSLIRLSTRYQKFVVPSSKTTTIKNILKNYIAPKHGFTKYRNHIRLVTDFLKDIENLHESNSTNILMQGFNKFKDVKFDTNSTLLRRLQYIEALYAGSKNTGNTKFFSQNKARTSDEERTEINLFSEPSPP
ncbi:MAG: hypothetical protein GY782_03255 [Gammaproteobacteria bacterium]|nr:hypothetical protein [Gammaproteobacteria bacterium]